MHRFTRSHYIRLLWFIFRYLFQFLQFLYPCQIFFKSVSQCRDVLYSLSILFKHREKIDTSKNCVPGKKHWSSGKEAIHGNSIRRGCSEVALPVLGRAGDEFPPFPDRLRCPTSLVLPACRRGRGGNGHGGRGRNRDSVFPRQRVGIGDVTSLVSGIRVTPLRVFLALRGGRGGGFSLLRQADPRIRSGNLQHPLDIGGLGPEKRRDASN